MKASHDPAAPTKFTPSHRKEGKGFHKEFSVLIPHKDCPGGPHPHTL